MPYAQRKKISNAMKGESNFEGKKHTSKGKQNISDGRGSYDPIKGKKWYVNKHSGKTFRKDRNPTETLYKHGRTVKKVQENFLDGRNPQDKGDSVRHGIPKNAPISLLKKIRSSKTASPRKKQLAHWQINMRQEAYYPGNLGAMELVKFHQKASAEEKARLKQHLASKEKDKALNLIQKVSGMKLHPSAMG